ncbi:MAG: M15 family metallopeptidase [Pseudobdellovibrionaceae bacterium]|jgi:D-alanyl-D-alanine dipeptidase|nr:M15 family metallopeptidase [Pseudobdellovibrionaceae bacterium]
MENLKYIPNADLIPFDLAASLPTVGNALICECVYAQKDHKENVFGQIYAPEARILGHKDMVLLVLLAAMDLHQSHEWTLIVKDCLRPVEAQQKMIDTDIVRKNPQWLEEPRFLSSPGQGGHPRGLAVDLSACDKDGRNIDFGTAFDHFSHSSDAAHNPAHRQHPHLAASVRENRGKLDRAMERAAKTLKMELVFLSTEWWDFRMPAAYSNMFSPIRDADLEPWQKMITAPSDIPQAQKDKITLSLTNSLKKFGNF